MAASSRVDPSSTAVQAGALLVSLKDPALAIVLVEAFLSRPEGPEPVSYTHLTLPTSDLV